MNSGHFKTIFSKRLGCLVAVGEHASSQGKATGAASGQFVGFAGTDWLSTVLQFVGVLTASCALVTLAWAGPVATSALPTGGQVAQGAASISQSGAVMNITQSTSKAVVNWNTFDIGQNAKVNIVQPGADAVMLNSVTSANPSQILGQLNANGQVVLVNPNGVLFGKDGSVNASSFTASTLGITDANFMAGNQQFERNGSTATVVNQGRINTTGGYVALLGASVSNEGQINTQGGTAYLAAAETVKIPVSGSGRIKLELSPSRINAAVANGKTGTIVTEGGQVYMQATSLSTMVASIIQSGSIDATGVQGGAVHLLADGGQIKVSGSITANSTQIMSKGGDIIIGRDTESGVLAKSTDASGAKLESKGGFVETSGGYLEVDGISVKAKDWLLDPTNIRIVSGTPLPFTPSISDAGAPPANTTFQDTIAVTESQIKNTTIQDALNAGTNVKISTGLAGSVGTSDGNIVVDAVIVKNGSKDAKLTLEANNGIIVNQRIGKASSDTSTGKLDVTMTASGNAATVTNRSGLTLNSVIDAGDGNVSLTGTNSNTNSGSRGVNFNNGSGITANTITVTGTAKGSAEWNQGVLFSGTSSFKSIGSSVMTGISSSTAGAINSAVVFNDGSNVTLDGGTGSLTVQGTHDVAGYGGIRFGAYGGSSTNPSLTTKGNVTLGTQDSSNASLNAGFMLRGGLITADTGSLTIKGQATGTGINLYDGYGTIKSNGGAITLNGVATTSGHGVYFNSNQVGTLNSGGDVTIIGSGKGGNQGVQFNGGNVRVYGNNVTINGTANTASGQTGYGFYSMIGPGAGNTITAAGNLSITGTLNGAGSGTAVAHTSTNWQNLVNAYTAGGTLSITGTNNASTANTGATITMAGVQARAGGDLTVSATNNNAATDAISIYSALYLSGGAAPGYQGGASSFVSTGGNTTLKSNQGAIFIQDGVPNSVTSTAITGKNVIIDNTGGTFTGGVFTAGSGTATSTTHAGVQISDGLASNDLYLASNPTLRTITASDTSGQIVLSGKSTGNNSTSSQGVRIGSTVSFVAPTTSLLGTSTASNGISTTAAITATGQIGLTGERTTPGVGLNIGAAISTTGTSSTTTLTSTTGAVSGTGNITTAAGNTGSITVNSAMAGTLSGVISGGGSLVKQGAGTTTLTGTNTYAGTTTISAGTLQVGSGGSTGTLGAGDVTLANGAGLVYNRNVDTVINNTISGNGTVSATITGNLDVAKAVNLSAVGNTVNLNASGNITQSAGSITATNLYLTATSGGIGTLSKRITSNVSNLAMSSAGNQFSGQVNALNLAAKTTGSGNIDVKTTNGTLNVTSVNGINGVTSAGTGNITLDGTSTGTSGTGLNIAANITGNGDVVLTGKTAADNRPNNTVFAGITNGATVTAKNITLNALASNTTADVLGYYGAGGSLIATNNLTATAESKGAGVGFYMWSGKTQSGTGMSITGTSNIDSGIGLDNGAQVLNKLAVGSATGNLILRGSTNSTSRSSVGLYKTIIENTSADGGVQITAVKGDVIANSGQANTITNAGSGAVVLSAGPSLSTDSGAIDGTNLAITQNGSGGVQVTTSGAGNVTAPKIINNGTGNVVVAAGTAIAAGTGTGGQVKTVSGNTITQNSTGKTYVYTGNAIDTGALSNLSVFNSGLFLSTILANTKNAVANAAYGSTIPGGASAQVMFREKVAIQVNGGSVTKTYGDVNTSNSGADVSALNASLKSAVIASNAGTITQTSAAGTLNISSADLMNDVSLTPSTGATYSRASFLNAGSYDFGIASNQYTMTLKTGEVARVTVGQLALTGSVGASQSVYGSPLVKGTVTLTKILAGDVISPVVTIDTTGNTSSSGNLKFGSYAGIQSVTALSGSDAGNYSFSDINRGDYNVSKLALGADIAAVQTTYGSNAGIGGVQFVGAIAGDLVGINSASLIAPVYSSSGNLKAGTYVQSVSSGVSGTDADNYNFSGTSSANYVVSKLALNTQIAGVTTTYGTTAATGAASVSGVLSGDKVDLGNAKATLVDAANSSSSQLKAGTYKQTVANGLSGDDAANYTAAPTSLANYVVTPKAIAATVTAADKVYDGNNAATLNANSAGILTGDVVNVLGATGTFASKNVARDGAGNVVAQTVTVTGTGVGLGGTDGANYTLTNATSIASTTAKITPKDLSVSGITASDKVYDGTTTATINTVNAVVSGLVTGDSVSVSTQSGVGNFASKDVAFDGAGVVASQAVTVSGLSLNGTSAGNYNVSDKSGASAKVLQRALSITGSVAQDKTVDGNTNAQVKPGQLVNLVAGESLVVSATGQFADAEIGSNKAVTTQYALANGANGVARNYTLAGEVLRAAILVAAINPVQPIVNPSRTSGGGRVVVSGSGNSGAALGVAEGSTEDEVISREECSVLNPEKCECQESTIPGVEMCFAPVQAANSKN
ncbi:YDG domain-containing protein [Limnohabitans sp. 15K]|uniref:YDG domain-containing protein n=1 Tax=Limnohabitans sp. 15K TaxID=1100706 RepID=UPI000C1E93EB|nr:YDG domain-containing protein [Limnohabitans sp. 15K]PIT81891.1 hypothetical protein B9Z40_09890 [Limnohabitans sp. 15K]